MQCSGKHDHRNLERITVGLIVAFPPVRLWLVLKYSHVQMTWLATTSGPPFVNDQGKDAKHQEERRQNVAPKCLHAKKMG